MTWITSAGDGGDIPCGDSNLADTVVVFIPDVQVTYVKHKKYEEIKRINMKKCVPAESNATPNGWYNEADVAGPISPTPTIPEIVDIIPVDTVTFRMRLL